MAEAGQEIVDGIRQAVALLNGRRPAEAERLLLDLRRRAPEDPWIAFNLGLIWWHGGRRQEAIDAWSMACRVAPEFAEPAINLSNALAELGRFRESLPYCQRAADLRPELPGPWRNLALTLMAMREPAAAAGAADRCLALQPDDRLCMMIRIDATRELGMTEECDAAARRFLALPGLRLHGVALQALYRNAAMLSRWDELQELGRAILDSARTSRATPAMLATMWVCDDPRLLLDLARRRMAGLPRPAARPSRRAGDGRITVGYMSPDYRVHPVMHMLLPLLAAHDRERFRLIAIGLVPPTGSQLEAELRERCDGYLDLGAIDEAQAAERIREAGVDVLVDLAGSTQWSRPGILALRPAAVQALWMGFAASTGTDHFDALLADAVCAPPGYEAHCSEPLLRLPCCYHPITCGAEAPAEGMTRADAGLPADAIVLAMLQTPAKVRPEQMEVVAGAMREHPRTALWLAVLDDAAQQRVHAWFAARGIPAERVLFARREADRGRYLGRMPLADLVLDTYPYGGHSTAGEAIAQGVPVLTRAGPAMHTRVAASMLHQVGLDELVASDLADFAARLQRLLADPAALPALRTRCREAASSLAADGQRTLARALEAAYRDLLARAPA